MGNLQSYKNTFVRNYHEPYIIQPPTGHWRTVHKNINDKVIQDHLNHRLWAGIFPGYYIKWGLLDFDNPPQSFIDQTISRVEFDRDQFILCTSPSYGLDGSVHLLFKPEYDGYPLTIHKFTLIMDHFPNIIQGKLECYPNQGRGIRLPFGAKQHLIQDGLPLPHLSWEEQLYWFQKVESTDLAILHKSVWDNPGTDPLLPFSYSEPSSKSKCQGAIFYREGLQDFRTRHDATLAAVIWLFHQNYPPENAKKLTREWIEKKHNGLSQTINKGDWKTVYREIHEIVAWVYEKFERRCVFPDAVHNDYYAGYECDIDFIAKIFPGNITNQKKMFRLISYFRPRMKHDWVYCSQKKWIEIAGANQYKEFQLELIRRGILEADTSYWVKQYPKKFRLHLPDHTNSSLIQSDGRVITDFKEAVMMVYKISREAIQCLGLSKQTVYEWFRNYENNNTYY